MGEKKRTPSRGSVLRKKRTTFGSFRVAAGSAGGLLRNPERPASFDFLFWSILALTYAFHIFAPEIPLREFGLAPMTLVCAVLVAVWLALPWNPSATRLRKLLSPAFVVAATAMLLASDLIWALGFYPIAFANAVFLFGLGAAPSTRPRPCSSFSSSPSSVLPRPRVAHRRRSSSRGGP